MQNLLKITLEQVICRKLSGDLAQPLLRRPKFLGEEIQLLCALEGSPQWHRAP